MGEKDIEVLSENRGLKPYVSDEVIAERTGLPLETVNRLCNGDDLV